MDVIIGLALNDRPRDLQSYKLYQKNSFFFYTRFFFLFKTGFLVCMVVERFCSDALSKVNNYSTIAMVKLHVKAMHVKACLSNMTVGRVSWREPIAVENLLLRAIFSSCPGHNGRYQMAVRKRKRQTQGVTDRKVDFVLYFFWDRLNGNYTIIKVISDNRPIVALREWNLTG